MRTARRPLSTRATLTRESAAPFGVLSRVPPRATLSWNLPMNASIFCCAWREARLKSSRSCGGLVGDAAHRAAGVRGVQAERAHASDAARLLLFPDHSQWNVPRRTGCASRRGSWYSSWSRSRPESPNGAPPDGMRNL
jgi:hypothetical protein